MEIEGSHMASIDMQQKFKSKIMESTILDSFTKLSTDTDRERIYGGTRLLKHLSEPQDNDKSEKEFNYVVDRLFKGVGTSRINARKGFYTTLVALLSTSTIPFDKILDVIKKQLQNNGGGSKSEKADLYMGQILSIGAIIKSGLFERFPKNDQEELLQLLINAGKQRSFLSLASYSFLISLIENTTDEIFSEVIWPLMQVEVLLPWNEQRLDTLWFLIISREKFPNYVKTKLLKNKLGASNIINEDSIQHICELLMNTPMLITLQHPFYKLISKKLASSEHLLQFCSLLNSQFLKYNRNKLIISLTIINYILEDIEEPIQIPELLLPNLLKECIKILPTIKHRKDDEINIQFNALMTTLNKKLSSPTIKSKVKITILKRILFTPGNFMFEKITSSKIVQQITMNLNTEGVKKLSKIYRNVIMANKPKNPEDANDLWLNIERVYAAHALNRLLSHPTVQNETEWRFEQLKFLLDASLLNPIDGGQIGSELAGAIKECFYHALDQKLSKLQDLKGLLSQLVHYVNDKLSEDTEQNNIFRNTLNTEALDHWNKMIKLVKKLEKRTNKTNSDVIPIFHTLLLHMGLQLFIEKNLAMNTLEELHSCYKRAEMKQKEKLNTEIQSNDDDDDDEPYWVEVLVDLFLSLLSRNNHLFRRIINYVFPKLCPYLSTTAIHQILNVLDPNNDNNPFLNQDSDDEESEEEPEVENEKLSNDEETDLSDIDDYEDEPVNDKLRMAIREALSGGTVTMKSDDEESIDIDDIDEEEGKRLDKALSLAFRNIKGGKKSRKQSKDERILTHFRVRVLDLIDLYLDSEPSLGNVLEIMIPLLRTLEFSIRDSHQKPLENRLRSCLNKLARLKKFKDDASDITEVQLTDLLKSFLDKGSITAPIFKDMGDIITKCCIFIIKSFKNDNKQLTSSVQDYLCLFFEKRDCLLPSILFNEILKLTWNCNWSLAPLLIDYAFNSQIRPFRRNQALTFLITFYKNQRLLSQDLTITKLKCNQFEKLISEHSITLLENSARNPKESIVVKEKFIYLLMTLLQTINNVHKQLNIESVIDWEQIGKAVTSYRSSVTLAKDAKQAYNKLCAVLGISSKTFTNSNKQNENGVIVVTQNENDRISEDDDANDLSDTNTAKNKKQLKRKRQKAKAMRKDTQLLKKQTKKLRMEAMQEGLEGISFTGLENVHDENGVEEDVVEDSNEIKKKSGKRKHSLQNGCDDSSHTKENGKSHKKNKLHK